MNKLCITDEPEYFKDKRVILRVDYNVVKDGKIEDTFRIDSTLETIKKLLEYGAKGIILLSHSGRPKGKDESLSLKPVAGYLKDKLGFEVYFHDDVEKEIPEGHRVVLVENLRFWEGEGKNDKKFAEKLARFGDVYVNDAFAVSHRENASVSAIAEFFEKRFAGMLMKKELENLTKVRENPEKPFYVLFGGAKVSDKIPILEKLVDKSDKILIGGAMAYTFLKAKGESVGKSRVEEEQMEWAKNFISNNGNKVELPIDHVALKGEKECKDVKEEEVEEVKDLGSDYVGYDIGFETVKRYRDILKGAKMIFWNGPMGMYECEPFECGTKLLAVFLSCLKDEGIKVIVGGGDTVAAIRKFDIPIEDFEFVSTGGGATLEFLAGKDLPGIKILTDKQGG
ncbi:MAG: phosphoglycerate kinase [candidate division WOR-3 bacterium]